MIYNLPNIGKQCFDGLFYGIQQLEQEYDSGPEGAASVIKKLGLDTSLTSINKFFEFLFLL